MKHIKTTLAAVLAVALTGCASTSQPDRTDYPTLTVLNPTPYVWDDKKSLALNVAKMAEPAGVGIGLEDSDKASDASTGRSTTGDRVFGLALMGLSQGVYGLASDSVLTDKAEKALKWQPSVIDLVPVSEIGADLTPQAFLKLRTYVGDRFISAIKRELPDVKLHATYTPKGARFEENAIFILNTVGCSDSIKFHSFKPESAPKYLTRDISSYMIEKTPMPREYCQLSARISIAGTFTKNDVEHYIVVSELMMGQNFVVQMSKTYSGYILIPERFDVSTYDVGSERQRTLYPYAVVFLDGKPQNFVMPQ